MPRPHAAQDRHGTGYATSRQKHDSYDGEYQGRYQTPQPHPIDIRKKHLQNRLPAKEAKGAQQRKDGRQDSDDEGGGGFSGSSHWHGAVRKARPIGRVVAERRVQPLHDI